jgi:hypothetical protein
VFERRDKDLAALIPMADLHLLQGVLESTRAQPAWDGLRAGAVGYDWGAAERVRRDLEVDDMH